LNEQTKQAIEMAIEALEKSNFQLNEEGSYSRQIYNEQAIIACKEALARPAQEPVIIEPEDIRIEYWNSNILYWDRSLTGIKITHLKTGIVVTEESDRSQHKNKALAMERLTEMLSDYVAQPAQEPYIYEVVDADDTYYTKEPPKYKGFYFVKALYANPVPVRAPLSVDDAITIIERCTDKTDGTLSPLSLVRAVERFLKGNIA
jgi:hypothetical protein